jgi:phosphopantetheinyl transferase
VPVFFQQQINDSTRLGIWKIEEMEEYFKGNVPLHRDVTHPHKRLQHLAGRFLLQFLFPGFPFELIKLADTKKPFLPRDDYHFSISHCGDYAAAIVSKKDRVGIDIEIPVEKLDRISDKFITAEEKDLIRDLHYKLEGKGESGNSIPDLLGLTTILWSTKECIFKWYGKGEVDFKRHINIQQFDWDQQIIHCYFSKTKELLEVKFKKFDGIVLAWVVSKC